MLHDVKHLHTALPACSSSNMQLMRAADYYFQHLDQKVQVVVVSNSLADQHSASDNIPQQLSKPATAQQHSSATPSLHPAVTSIDEELDKLLLSGGTEDFEVEALRPVQPQASSPTTPSRQVSPHAVPLCLYLRLSHIAKMDTCAC